MKLKDSKNTFTALADETRLRILNLLSEGELCVCDLMNVLDEPQSKISRHLAYLRKANLVQGRKEGLWMHYRLSPSASLFTQQLIKTIGSSRSECAELQNDLNIFNQIKNGLVSRCK